jgi:hypothetical protein
MQPINQMVLFAAEKSVGAPPSRAAGTDKQAQGCAGEGLNPEGISPRLRARVLATTGAMSLLASTILRLVAPILVHCYDDTQDPRGKPLLSALCALLGQYNKGG